MPKGKVRIKAKKSKTSSETESIGSDSNRENPANDEQMSETSHTSLSLVLY